MSSYFILALVVVSLGFLAVRAGRIWIDARQRRLSLVDSLRWASLGAVQPTRYWWQARIDALSAQGRRDLLARETRETGLGRADSVRCPLCEAEVPNAWAITARGEAAVARGPVECPRCDFRLDACRHCSHFLPGSPNAWGQSQFGSGDLSFGRCQQYKSWVPIEQATSSEMARRLRERGYERVRAPRPIQDSFLPPDFCNAFQPDRRRLRIGRIRWPDARRIALLRLLQSAAPPERPNRDPAFDEQEQWLL